MRLDHVSYAASHDQISDVVNRIGSQIGTAFIDGGIHPKFGTRNFTAPLLNGQYIEVVCPLDHPATDTTPFGRAVKKKSQDGGGWMAWIIATDDISKMETLFNRSAINGERTKPDGSILKWKQIGTMEILEDFSQPFFIEWLSEDHPGEDGIGKASLTEIVFESHEESTLKNVADFLDDIKQSLTFKFIESESNYECIKQVNFMIDGQKIIIS